MSTNKLSTERQLIVASASIFTLLFTLYMLSYGGTFTSEDEIHLTSGAQTFAIEQRLSAMQVYGNPRLKGGFHEVDPALSVFGSFVYNLISKTNYGSIQTLFFLTSFWTAITGVLVLVIGVRLGYSLPLASFASLCFGIGTFAWPYAKTFFRDPLAMMFVAGALLCFELVLVVGRSARSRLLFLVLLVVMLTGGVLAKNIVIPIIPILVLAAITRSLVRADTSSSSRKIIITGAFIFLVICVFLLARPTTIGTYRSSRDYFFWLIEWLRVIPHDGFFSAVAGALISPGKGIVFYAPMVLLVLASWVVAWRTAWQELLAPTAIFFALVLAQAYFYDYRWTNSQWGTRYLLPSLPGLAIATLPAAAWLQKHFQSGAKLVLGSVLGIGVLTQLPGVLIAPTAYSAIVLQLDRRAFFDIAIWDTYYSAIAGHWRLVFSGQPWSLAWVRNFSTNSGDVVLLCLALTGCLVISVVTLKLSSEAIPSIKRIVIAVTLATSMAIFVPVMMLNMYQRDPAYLGDQTAITDAVNFLNANANESDLITVRGYLSDFWYAYLNFGRPRGMWVGLPIFDSIANDTLPGDPFYLPGIDADVADKSLFENSSSYKRIWFVSDDSILRGTEGFDVEDWLNERYYFIQAKQFEGTKRVRVLLFSSERR